MAGDGTFTVASMNLHCGLSSSGQPFDVSAAVRRLDATVVAVQETWTAETAPGEPAPDPLAAAAHDLGARLMRVPMIEVRDLADLGLPGGSGPGQFGIAVLTTLPVSEYDVVSLGTAPGDAIPRFAQVIRLTLGEQAVLRFVNTHLTHRFFSPAQLWRLRHALQEHAEPTVIAGDLNMPRPVATLTSGFTAAVAGRTWPADSPLLQLDHVLVGGGVEAVTGAVLPHTGSDHLPILAELRLRAARHRPRRGHAAAADSTPD